MARFLCASVAIHCSVFFLWDRLTFRQVTYSVAKQVAGISVELVPGPPAAEAALAPSEPAIPSSSSRPVEIPKKDFEVPAPEIQKELPKVKRSPEKQVPKAAPHSSAAALQGAAAQMAPQADGLGQGGGSPDVRAEPDYLQNPPPKYPRESRLNEEEGTAIFTVRISATGEVVDMKLKKSSTFPRLDVAAADAIRSWKFKPARIAGMAVASSVEVPIKFVLH